MVATSASDVQVGGSKSRIRATAMLICILHTCTLPRDILPESLQLKQSTLTRTSTQSPKPLVAVEVWVPVGRGPCVPWVRDSVRRSEIARLEIDLSGSNRLQVRWITEQETTARSV